MKMNKILNGVLVSAMALCAIPSVNASELVDNIATDTQNVITVVDDGLIAQSTDIIVDSDISSIAEFIPKTKYDFKNGSHLFSDSASIVTKYSDYYYSGNGAYRVILQNTGTTTMNAEIIYGKNSRNVTLQPGETRPEYLSTSIFDQMYIKVTSGNHFTIMVSNSF